MILWPPAHGFVLLIWPLVTLGDFPASGGDDVLLDVYDISVKRFFGVGAGVRVKASFGKLEQVDQVIGLRPKGIPVFFMGR